MFVKGEHERCFAYAANTACNKNNFILDFVVGAGNIHDSQMFHGVYKKLDKYNDTYEVVAVDADYKTSAIMREIIKNGKIPSVPYKWPMSKQRFFRKYEYIYDEYYDYMICPANQVLKYSTTNKEGYREYKSDAKTCTNCSLLSQCTNSKNCVKIVTSHVWSKYMELEERILVYS